jgi:hypothetical protein
VHDEVIYTPSQCIRWLEMGAGGLKETAKGEARKAKEGFQERNIGDAVRKSVSAALQAARGYLAELAGKKGEATEYRLYEERVELVSLLKTTTLEYADVRSIAKSEGTRYRYVLATSHGDQVISPVAWITAGSARVPIGWERNGIEVPYMVLVEELAARCAVRLEE